MGKTSQLLKKVGYVLGGIAFGTILYTGIRLTDSPKYSTQSKNNYPTERSQTIQETPRIEQNSTRDSPKSLETKIEEETEEEIIPLSEEEWSRKVEREEYSRYVGEDYVEICPSKLKLVSAPELKETVQKRTFPKRKIDETLWELKGKEAKLVGYFEYERECLDRSLGVEKNPVEIVHILEVANLTILESMPEVRHLYHTSQNKIKMKGGAIVDGLVGREQRHINLRKGGNIQDHNGIADFNTKVIYINPKKIVVELTGDDYFKDFYDLLDQSLPNLPQGEDTQETSWKREGNIWKRRFLVEENKSHELTCSLYFFQLAKMDPNIEWLKKKRINFK